MLAKVFSCKSKGLLHDEDTMNKTGFIMASTGRMMLIQAKILIGYFCRNRRVVKQMLRGNQVSILTRVNRQI